MRFLRVFAPFALLAASPALAADGLPASIDVQLTGAKTAMVSNPQDALRNAAKIEQIARRLSGREQTLGLAMAIWLRGEVSLRSDQQDRAAALFKRALTMIEPIAEPLKLRGDLLMSQGAYYRRVDQAGAALANFTNAHKIFVQVKEPRSQALALQNIALLYYDANDNVRAERYFREAAEAYSGDPQLLLSLHNNRGNVLLVLERYAEAAKEYQEGIAVARKTGDPILEARVLVNLARSQVDLKQFAQADQTLARGFALVGDGEKAPMLRRHLLATSARLASDRGDYTRAAQLIRECFEGVDLESTTADYRNAHLYAHEIFSRIGQPDLALKHLEALKRLTDEATKVATSTSAALLAAEFDYQGQQLTIAQKQTEAQQFQKMLWASLGLGSLLVTALLAWGLITTRRSRNKVAAANIELGKTNVALEKALKAKTEFLATTSHEIRTPLNGILGMTQVMLSDPKLDPQTRERIGIAHSAGVTMRSLVDDILDVAKMENGNLTVDPAPMDVCAVLRDVTRIWGEQARAKGLRFDLELSDAPCWIVSDAGRLRQIVFNLLSNAIKFTEQGGVTVRALDEGEGESRRLKLVIEDTGIGIPADKFDAIFESFRQVDTSTTRRFGGTGLGLAICRNLAQALGGEILVESAEGSGSRFVVDLPLVPAEAPEVPEPAGAAAGASLLIVDRNPIARAMYKTLFEPRVATLRFAGNADEALELLRAGPITDLLADEATIKATEGDPMETLGKLVGAAGDASSNVLWTQPDEAAKSQLTAVGVGQIIEKPIAGAALIDAVLSSAVENSAEASADSLATRAA